MKILLTGFTQRMVNSLKLRYDYLTSVFVLRDALVSLGHQVDHRRVAPGDDLSGYDRALIGVGPTKSFTARFVPGAAYAFRELAGRVTLYCDDWSIEKTGYDFRNTLARWDKWLKFFQDCGPVKGQELEGHGARCVDVRKMLDQVVNDKGLTLLAPMFPWGDHALLMKDNLPSRLVDWDPTPLLAPHVSPPLIQPKKREWVLATLQKKDVLPMGQWPVLTLGNKRQGQEYQPESEILRLYDQSWGVICPPYQRAGSGWWRARYQHAADAGCVLWLAAADKAVMGEPYQHSYFEYEKMSDAELQHAAFQQRLCFTGNTATRHKTRKTLSEVIGE